MKSLISTLLLVVASSVLAQSPFKAGYIVTNKSETIYGEVEDRAEDKNYRSCLFKSKDGVVTEYYPQRDLKGYGFLGDKFFSAEIRDGFFVEVLVEGEMSLYQFNEIFYLRKKGEIFTLESKPENDLFGSKKDDKWKGVVSYLVSDCLNNTKAHLLGLHEKDLTTLITSYNECKDSDFTIFKEEKQWSTFHYGISAGLSNSTIKTKWAPQPNGESLDYISESYTSLDPVFGITGFFLIPRISENFSFQFEVNFMKSNYSALVVRKESQQTSYHETHINLETLNVPTYINYTYPLRNISLFVQAGASCDINTKSDSRALSETLLASGAVITSPEKDVFRIRKGQGGVLAGFGVLKSYDHFQLSLSIKFIQMSGLSRTQDLRSAINRISYSLIITKQ